MLRVSFDHGCMRFSIGMLLFPVNNEALSLRLSLIPFPSRTGQEVVIDLEQDQRYCIRTYFKTSSQAQSLRWNEAVNPRNSLLLLWLSPSIRLDLEPD